MRLITPEEFQNFPVVNGVKQCPTGDYSLIKEFPEYCSFAKGCSFAVGCSFAGYCSFAEGCSFAERCSFAEYCSFARGCSIVDKEILQMKSLGSLGEHQRTLYLWKTKEGFFLQAGCFFGTPEEFTNAVLKKYKNPEHEYIKSMNFLISLMEDK